MSIVPKFLYGTAWKEEQTEKLTALALETGFTAFDTANQRKHYYEEGVGHALRPTLLAAKRDEIFIQTKFTYIRGQDHRLPYDPKAEMSTQVRQSFASSLEHLGVSHLDSYLLHGPETTVGLTENDWEVWRTIEELQRTHKIQFIGISNVDAAQLEELARKARVKPAFVQNRCYPSINWDRQTRDACMRFGIIYQGFSLIRDPLIGRSKTINTIATRHKKTIPQIIYRFALQRSVLPMIGTSNGEHMKEALEIFTFELSPEEIDSIENMMG